MSSAINTKIYIRPGQQVRRASILPETTLEVFKQQLLYSVESSPLFAPGSEYHVELQYFDEEGDWISVNTEHEWKEGLRIAALKPSELFRVKVVLLAKRTPQVQAEAKSQASTPLFSKRVAPQSEVREIRLDELLGHLFGHSNRQGSPGNNSSTSNDRRNTDKQPQPQLQQQNNPLHETADLEEWVGVLDSILGSLFSQTELVQPQQRKSGSTQQSNQQEKPQPSISVQSNADSVYNSQDHAQQATHQQQVIESQFSQEKLPNQGIQGVSSTQLLPDELQSPTKDEHQKQLNVQSESSSNIQQQQHQQQQPEADLYHQDLKVLESMGFTNTTLNRHLLNYFNGNIPKVVSSLLEVSQN